MRFEKCKKLWYSTTLENAECKKQQLDPEVGKHFLKKPHSNIFSLWAHGVYGKYVTVPLQGKEHPQTIYKSMFMALPNKTL